MTRKICITGPEATGKSTLAKSLATEYDCPWVSEYARSYLNQLGRPYIESDLEKILEGQLALEEKSLAPDKPFLFVDTGPEVIWVWSQFKFGRVSPMIEKVTRSHDYHRTLLMDVDLEWSPDPLRENPSLKDRETLLAIYRSLLTSLGRQYGLVSGKSRERVVNAKKFIDGRS